MKRVTRGIFRSRKQKILMTIVVLGVTAGITQTGTYAAFTSTANVAQASISSGLVTLAVPGAGTSNRLTLGASNIVPGDTLQRAVDLNDTGNTNLASITLTVTATSSSLLDTDTTNGLQLVVDKCSVPWTESGSSPAYTYTCSGATSSVLASRAVIGATLALSNLTATTAGATDHLRVTLTFPSGAGNSLQNQTSAITFAFIGSQRTATNE